MDPPKKWRRNLRLRLAPVGSQRDRWLRERIRTWSKFRQVSLQAVILRLLPKFLAQPIKNFTRQRRITAAQPYREQFEAILASQTCDRQVIVFPPSLDWNVQLFQRPQQLAMALADKGVLIFYLHLKVNPNEDAFKEIHPNLFLCNVPIETFACLESPLVYVLTWNRKFVNAFNNPRIIYDFVDDIRVFDGNYRELVQDHERLVNNALLVLTTAEKLFSSTHMLRQDTILCPNGVDYSHFAVNREKDIKIPPDDLIPIVERGNPIVGYYGALAEWFDYELVRKTARLREDISIVIIGPDYDGTMPPSFLDLPNLDWLGVKSYDELPAYLAYFDVAMIPFLLNEITHATSPLKLFEYMAGGKPVIVTPMQESMRYDGVLVADSPLSFSKCIDQALMLRKDSNYLQQIDHLAKMNTWRMRAEQILFALGESGKILAPQ